MKKKQVKTVVNEPVFFSFSLQDLVRFASRKVPEANIVMFQEMPRQMEIPAKDLPNSGSEFTWHLQVYPFIELYMIIISAGFQF